MLKRLSTFLRLTPPRAHDKNETPAPESEPAMAPSAMPTTLDSTNGIGSMYEYPPANPEGPYKVLDQYHSKASKMRVACAGAGASGLCLAYKMEKMLTPATWELTLFEKNPQFGGTWYENTYPGVACDIPSHDYNFTWDPKPDWTQFFAAGKEIQGYFEGFAERHGMLAISKSMKEYELTGS